jgi:hypothetical protein
MFKLETEFPFYLNSGHQIIVLASCDRVWNWDTDNLLLKFETLEGDPLQVVYDKRVFQEIEFEAIHWLLFEKENAESAVNDTIVSEIEGGGDY